MLSYSSVALLALALALESLSQEVLQAPRPCLSSSQRGSLADGGGLVLLVLQTSRNLGFSGGTPEPGVCTWEGAPTCTQCTEHELKSVCEKIIIKKKKSQQHGPTRRRPLENLWLL